MRDFESREDYLENMLLLKLEKGYVRSTDVAAQMGFSKPSVSRAVGLLKASGHIAIDPVTGYIDLTESGLAAATAVYERHTLLTRFLEQLGVEHTVAAQDACRMEHVMSDESFERIRASITRGINEKEK